MRGNFTLGEVILVRVAVFKHWHGSQARQKPGEFGDFGDVALAKEHGFGRIQAAGQKIEGYAARIFPQERRFVNGGQGVIVGYEIEGFAFVLPFDAGPHHSEVVAEVGSPCGFDAGENAWNYHKKRRVE